MAKTPPQHDPNQPAQAAKPAPAKPAPATPIPVSGQQSAANPDEDPYDDLEGGGSMRFLMFNAVPSWLVSMVVHVIVMVALVFIPVGENDKKEVVDMVIPPEENTTEELEEFEIEDIEEIDVQSFDDVSPVSADVPMMVENVQKEDINLSDDIEMAQISVELSDFGEQTAPKSDLLSNFGSVTGTGVSGRGSAMRGNMVGKYGGNEASEAAVARALKWLAAHQNPNGSWGFDHRLGPCQGRCSHAGTLNGPNGATAMGLLPFLGAGQTHMEGNYKETVYRALDFLIRNQKPDGGGGSFHEGGGSMYSHGLAAIAMTEAYAMTHDKRLLGPAQASLNFIVYAQDPVGGGWRYQPKQAGDTSVVGWQLMALKSGHMAYLTVPPNVIKGATKFLDACSAESGAFYGYTGPGRGKATTAVGLLCRMYLGWDKDNPAIERGVQWLSEQGPAISGNRASMYYNYYATQVMRHYEGELWDKWNEKMRDSLVESQNKEKASHEFGSWHFTGDHGAERGGRLYSTSLATMILEVYYRHMPIYGKAAAKEDFPLE